MSKFQITPATDNIIPSKFSSLGQYLNTKRGRTYFELHGPEDGVPLVFNHGMYAGCFSYDLVTEQLSKLNKYRILCFDRYGLMNSGGRWNDCNMDGYIEQLEEMINFAFGSTKKVVLFGWSQGGAIAGRYATLHPERVSKVALLCPAAAGVVFPTGLGVLKVPVVGYAMWWAAGAKMVNFGMDNFKADGCFDPAMSDPSLDDFIDRVRWCANSKPDFLDGAYATLTTFNFDTEYLTWKIPSSIPCQLFWGDKDKITPLNGAAKIQSVVPHAELTTFSNAAHVFPYEKPNEVAKAITAFIEK